jgi:hypothetical protein
VIKNPCPVDGYTKREYVKQLIKTLSLENEGLKERLFHAVQSGTRPDWIKPFATPNII